MSFPKAYASKVRNALTASPHALNLRNVGGSGGYFFDIGTRLLEVYCYKTCILSFPSITSLIVFLSLSFFLLSSFDDPELKQLLHHSFQARLPQVIDQCLQESAPEASDFVSGLDEWEKQVFLRGQNSHLDTKDWLESRRMGARMHNTH